MIRRQAPLPARICLQGFRKAGIRENLRNGLDSADLLFGMSAMTPRPGRKADGSAVEPRQVLGFGFQKCG